MTTHPTQPWQGKRVLITGGLGFIGSHLARRLVDVGAQVTVLDALLPGLGGNRFNLHGYEDRLQLCIADQGDPAALEPVVRDQEFIFNLACRRGHLDSMREPVANLENNCRAHLTLLEACRRLNPRVRLIYTSTRQVYGRPAYTPVDEAHPLAPADIHSIHKQTTEWYHMLYGRCYGMWTTTLRLANIYGPRMGVGDPRHGFLGCWVQQLSTSGEIVLFGDGKCRRDMLHVDDLVTAMVQLAWNETANGHAYNIGGTMPVTLAELARLLIALAGAGQVRCVPFPAERLAIDIGDFCTDSTRLQQLLGWQPVVALDAGLQETLVYYRANGKHYW